MSDSTRKLEAGEIIATCNDFRRNLYPLFIKEKMMVSYYNSGPLPDMSDEPCEEEMPSLGLGYRYIRKPYEKLLDMLLMEPGFIKSEIRHPIHADAKLKTEKAIDTEINKIVHHRMISALRRVAGRAIIVGRAFMFRLSRWDWVFHTGRLLHAIDAPDDIYSPAFREWAFGGSLTLRDIDERLANARDGLEGWNKSGLANLKKYIIEATASEQEQTDTRVMERKLLDPFDDDTSRQPLDVYWYFRKNGRKNFDGEEAVDLYCVSRYGAASAIKETPAGGFIYQTLEISQSGKDQVLYHLPNAFESVDECLIAFLLDSRVSGDQELAQIDGTGKIMVPRLMKMEQLGEALVEGVAFGIAPHWAMNANVSPEDAKELAKNGLRPWDVVPEGIGVMQKNNALTGLNSGLTMLQMLGMSAEADADTGEQSPIGGDNQARFKDQAQQQIATVNAALSRRLSTFFMYADRLAQQQLATFCRSFDQWRSGDAGYYDVRKFQTTMMMLHRVIPAEYDPSRIVGKCRRLIGGDASATITQVLQSINMFGGQIGADGVTHLVREGLRAMWGDAMVDEVLLPEQKKPDELQVMIAQMQNASAMITLTPPQRGPSDKIDIHLQVHFQAAQAQIGAAQQQGSITPQTKQGVTALMQHIAQDAAGLPQQLQQQLAQTYRQLVQALNSIQVSGAGSKLELDQAEFQRRQAETQHKITMGQNLMADRGAKAELAKKKFMLELEQFLESQRTAGVMRAGQLLQMMSAARHDEAALQESQPVS